MRMSRALLFLLAVAAFSSPATAQSFEEDMAVADSLTDELKPAEALERYRAAYASDPTSYEAMWKFAGAQIDVAKQLVEKKQREEQDSLFFVAHLYADAAVRTDSTDPEGYFMLAQALGRLSRTKGGRERVQFGKEIYNAAASALAINPDHDGAHHVIGAWHAEVKRLSGVARFVAKTFLGGDYLGRASWDSAVAHLEKAVELRPEYTYHLLELAEVYLDLKRYGDARVQLERMANLPPSDVLDPHHKETALRHLEEIANKEGA